MNGNEKTRILNLLRDGAITTEEAEQLLNALEEREQPEEPAAEPVVLKDNRGRKPKKLRILVDSDEANKGKSKVNVSIPISLIRALGPIASSSIPKKTRLELEQQGIDVAAILAEVEELIESGTDEDFINVDSGDGEGEGNSKVRIYVE
ncbi:SHOCT-like domain-containing protein [Caproicibacter sp.]|uniref:SHOCT-like domain-containing protein n=1 Tax=Caproicibacter sp. TaxID=2814884 RepID=UPI00398962CC